MKPGMIRWNLDSLKPSPAGCLHNWRKFSAVFGTTSFFNCIGGDQQMKTIGTLKHRYGALQSDFTFMAIEASVFTVAD